jgi:hypothetical protein
MQTLSERILEETAKQPEGHVICAKDCCILARERPSIRRSRG